MKSATFATAAALAATPFAAAGLITTRAPGATCRCLPGDACWPATSSWDSLNSTVGGKLIATVPIGSVCHDPTYDEAACTALRDSWVLPQTQSVHGPRPHSYMSQHLITPPASRHLPRSCSLTSQTSLATRSQIAPPPVDWETMSATPLRSPLLRMSRRLSDLRGITIFGSLSGTLVTSKL
jgi:hypothetical protein